MSGVNGKVVAITRASSGIGETTALELAARGAAVVRGARRTDSTLAERIHASGGRAEVLSMDVTRRTDLEQLVATAVGRFERLDVLVSNAGIARTGLVAELDIDSWDAMIDVKLRSVLHGIAAALPVFRRQGRGHFVTIVTTSGLKSSRPRRSTPAPRTRSAPYWRRCAKSPPTASCARPRSRPATCAPNSPTTSTTPTSGNRCSAGWRRLASALTPWRVPSHSRSSSPTSRSATSPSGPLTETDNGQARLGRVQPDNGEPVMMIVRQSGSGPYPAALLLGAR